MFAMNEEFKSKFHLAQKIIFIAYCFTFGLILISLLILGRNAERISLGVLLLLASVFHFAEFIRNRKNVQARTIFLCLCIIGIVLGVVTITVTSMDLWAVCLMFGIMDVFSGFMELVTNGVILKRSSKNPLELAEYVISTADIVFGVLLICELEEGIFVHVLFLTFVFMLNGILSLIKTIVELKKNE